MTSPLTPDPSVLPTPASTRTAALIVAVAALLVGAAAGYLLGQRSPAMHTTQARCVSAQGAISCRKVDGEGNVDRNDDWTCGVPWKSRGPATASSTKGTGPSVCRQLATACPTSSS
ncbi:hypothetical protein [Nocardioides sp.]|uniref:hypothetical protein n=1 Tax=Nocardioides sp. TaxID=35761 RepID=UPI002ED217D7